MELKLNLTGEYDAYTLFIVLQNRKNELERKNHEHVDMILLLEGANNEAAKTRLDHEKHCFKMNSEEIAVIYNLIVQLEPVVDTLFNQQK